MAGSPDAKIMMEEEKVPLDIIPGLGGTQNNKTGFGRAVVTCCDDKHHRKLAICSIICGISCIGIIALINSVKAEKTTDQETAAIFSQRAKKFSIISIVTWVSILASIPILMALISYLFTLID